MKKNKLNYFLKYVAVITMLGCSTSLMAQMNNHPPEYFVDHESIAPGHELPVPYLIPDSLDYLECYQEGGMDPSQYKALASVTWSYKGAQFTGAIDGSQPHKRQITLKSDAFKNGSQLAQLVDKSGKLTIKNTGSVEIIVGCRYSETLY